jgi:hypothetical protein
MVVADTGYGCVRAITAKCNNGQAGRWSQLGIQYSVVVRQHLVVIYLHAHLWWFGALAGSFGCGVALWVFGFILYDSLRDFSSYKVK